MRLIVPAMAIALFCLAFPIRKAHSQEACFPECRDGYVCNPERQCVSECNPACDPGQRCIDGECYARVATPEVNAASVPTQAPAAAHGRSVLTLQVGAIYQFLDTSRDEVVTAPGLQLAALIFPLDMPLFVRPRVVIAIGEENYYEPSVDFGFELRRTGTRVNFSMQLAFVFGLWPSFAGVDPYFADVEPVGPYVGLAAGPMMEFDRVSLGLHLEHGYQLATDPNTRVSALGFVIGYAL